MENAEIPDDHVDQVDDVLMKPDEDDLPPRKPGSKAQGRKRTKTGCLTCRKRRIKCGEERPTCHNCTKSKRLCEGYNQRVVFKDPLNAYRPPPSALAQTSHSGSASSQPTVRRQSVQDTSVTQNPPIAPKHHASFSQPLQNLDTGRIPIPPPRSSPSVESGLYTFQTQLTRSPLTVPRRPAPSVDTRSDTVDRSHVPEPTQNAFRQQRVTHYDFNALIKRESGDELQRMPAQTSPQDWSAGPSSASSYTPNSEGQFPAPASFFPSMPVTTDRVSPRASSSNSSNPHYSPQSTSGFPLPTRQEQQGRISGEARNVYEALPHGLHGVDPRVRVHQSTTSMVVSGVPAYVHNDQADDDDPFDVSDDEDMLMEAYNSAGNWQSDTRDDHLKSNDLGIIVALQAGQNSHETQQRSYTSSMDRQDMLASYTPSPQSSPLNDSMMARVFCHFVNVTGPSISMFERHPSNSSLIFQGQPVPESQQHIWTYTFPTLALQNPALLHAMLALSSLHIAKLQNRPITASLKHYAIGIRRVAKCVSLPSKREQPATLAASLLLAFYECWSADHQKWSNHILGARQLVREIDFLGMTRYIKSLKIQKRHEERMRYYHAQQQGAGHNFYDDRIQFQTYVDDVDENIVSMLMGKKITYDEYGRVVDDIIHDQSPKTYSERDLVVYETQRDLFWWYCKQDAYQSILGGGRLLYGTFDHLILLMGRLANFAAKDLRRKRLAMKANGGWRPPERFRPQTQPRPSHAPQGHRHSYPQMPPQQPQMPNFSGMVPNVGEAKLPMGFSTSRDSSPQSTRSNEDKDLETQRLEAEEEWYDIRNSFTILQDHFGEDFQPLGPDFQAPIQTPFGTALQYRKYGIAGIWMNYYMALIVCHRAHPSMPPAAMMAAGIAARQTANFANEVGRIAAGIAPDCVGITEVNPGVGAALMESSTCLFVAGVQYQDPHQRAWTITRLRDIARLTGWQTAHAIVSGCEKSWIRTAELGKGPPYTRTSEEGAVPSIWRTSNRRIDTLVAAHGGGSGGDDEKRLVIKGTDKVHYALGVLGMEQDFENLNLDNDEDV
ncbi:hypothetical protein G7Y89_g12008 [Cudoniella acicularis]|uniref:Zn(2)-C6 fungal-type domain-containing protein n=1 Tax=Cudoniella acicularis TaxID=354080 RepID=A0A8H4RDF1_9HELO|nr:hypothetical protein G7Y89_g12008 [Cudoniella acicularis]